MPVIAQLAASSRGAGVVGNTALGLTTPGAGRMPFVAHRLCSLGPALPAVQLAAPARRLAPGLRVRGARPGYTTAGPATAARGAFCACAAQVDLLGVCPFPVLSPACRRGRCQRGFSYFASASRRPGRALAQYLVASSVGARGELTACARTLCLPLCTYTRGFATTEARVRSLTA